MFLSNVVLLCTGILSILIVLSNVVLLCTGILSMTEKNITEGRKTSEGRYKKPSKKQTNKKPTQMLVHISSLSLTIHCYTDVCIHAS